MFKSNSANRAALSVQSVSNKAQDTPRSHTKSEISAALTVNRHFPSCFHDPAVHPIVSYKHTPLLIAVVLITKTNVKSDFVSLKIKLETKKSGSSTNGWCPNFC